MIPPGPPRRWGAFVTGLLVGGVVAYACTADTVIGPDVVLDSLYIEPASSVIFLNDTVRLNAIGVDTAGRRFVYTLVTWSSSDAAVSVQANGTTVGTSIGAATVSASAGNLSATAAVTVEPHPVLSTSLDSVPFTTIANAPVPATQIVALTNGGGGTLDPVIDSVSYGAGATGWLAAALSGTASDTLALDVLTTALAAGSYKATVFLSSAGASNNPKTLPITLAVSLGPPDTVVADSGNGQAATVNTAVAVAPVARVLDQYNNPLPGVAVTFAVTAGGGVVNPTTTVTTDAAGRVRAVSWTLGTSAGTNTLRASTAGAGPFGTFSATGVAQTNVSPTQSTVVATTGTITACSSGCSAGTTASTITVTIRDGFGNPIANAAVTVAATGTNNGFSSSSGTANASGVFTTTFNSTKAEAKSISATGNGGSGVIPISQAAPVTVDAASAASIVVNGGNSQTARVGTAIATAPSVLVRDAFLNPVPNVTVTFSITAGGGSAIAPATPLTNSSGIATVGGFTLGGTSADDATGRMSNTMSASAPGAGSTSFTEYGLYTWSGDVSPVFASTCNTCHALTYGGIVGVPSSCGGWNYVVAGRADSSYVYTKMAGTPACGGNPMPPPGGSTAANLKIVRAWINNGALNN